MNSALEKWATWKEILSQSEIWDAWSASLLPDLEDLREWISSSGATEIWFSGAGTSAYIGDFVDCQTAILEYESGASLAFHTNLNVPDEHRRFCVIGALGMAEGDFTRGYLNVTDARTNTSVFNADYTSLGSGKGHYGADEMMITDIVAYLRGERRSLPVSVTDALVAGIAALAIDQARHERRVVDLGETWNEFDSYGIAG